MMHISEVFAASARPSAHRRVGSWSRVCIVGLRSRRSALRHICKAMIRQLSWVVRAGIVLFELTIQCRGLCEIERGLISIAAAHAATLLRRRRAGENTCIEAIAPMPKRMSSSAAIAKKQAIAAAAASSEAIQLGHIRRAALQSSRARARPIACKTCRRTLPRSEFQPRGDGKFRPSEGLNCNRCRAEGKISKGGRNRRRPDDGCEGQEQTKRTAVGA